MREVKFTYDKQEKKINFQYGTLKTSIKVQGYYKELPESIYFYEIGKFIDKFHKELIATENPKPKPISSIDELRQRYFDEISNYIEQQEEINESLAEIIYKLEYLSVE